MSLDAFMTRYLPPLEAEMRRVVGALPAEPDDYSLMLRYHLGWVDERGQPCDGASGKRVRPGLLLLCAEAAGGDMAAALPAAAAVELLHNFSLIHDDIQDESPTRRGRPTVWAIWGRANAINAGDAMYTLAYAALWDLVERGAPPVRALDAWRLFTDTCLALTQGQHLDMAFEHQASVSLEAYLRMIGGKSAALIAASAQLGALVAGADADRQAHFAAFGRNLGLAFQIRDDILGIWGEQAATGKSTQTDIATRKKTLPVIYALERCADLRALYRQPDAFTPEDVARATALIEATGAKAYAEKQEQVAHRVALDALRAAQPAPDPGHALETLAGWLLKRAH
ncbi:MAG: polyprenyl synthetase family protein [Anaerolineae bacterium]